MEKQAISRDPQQQKLRERKKGFNAASREFIKRLIAFKKGLNGQGSPSYHIPPSDIKNPLPSELAAFIHELAGNFQQLVEEALAIEQEQRHYSETRRKPQPKREEMPTEPNAIR